VQYKSDQPPAESKTDRLNQALVNIEDDLHRILYILLQQCEMVHRKRHTKHSNVCLALKPTESRSSKGGETRKERPKLSRESRAISQPNLFSQTSEQQDAHELAASAKHIRPQSNERRSSLPRKQQKGPEICHGHYHITKPDVHWILGTSSNPSFSMMARRQIQLASLKQHGTLCMKSTPNLLTIDCAPEDRAQMISRIQTMINELQFEYDRWYRLIGVYQCRKLQFQQSVDDHSREDSAEISHLSSHLIHIMDQLVELHQLNKSFL
ncbi:hypothetical protein TYRP_010515, partial [Tyrophagus putrescentiae]